MLRFLITFLALLQGTSGAFIPITAHSADNVIKASSAVLCLPGIYMVDPQDCLPLGPSAYKTSMASDGISLPLVPLPSHPIDASLGDVPYQYALLGDGPTPVYASLEDAIAGKNPVRTIEPGKLRYVSYIDYEEVNNSRYFLLHDETWIQVASRVSIPTSYRGGIELTRTPVNSFGWVLPFSASIETQRNPGYAQKEYTGHSLHQYDLIQVYSVQQKDNTDWYLVAPNEWVEGRYIGRVIPNTNPPSGVTNGRWIEVNLAEQTLSVYDHNRLVFATLIASGLDPFFTKPGLFQIERKLDSTLMSGTFELDRSDFYYLEDVPWTMYYDHARALHGAYWRTAFGFPQSHGCVNLSPPDAHWLFDWANKGDWVYVWDPSGKTPTDPKYYGEGGA